VVDYGVAPGADRNWWYDTQKSSERTDHKAVWNVGGRSLSAYRSDLLNCVWERQSSSTGTWGPLHTDQALLKQIHSCYINGHPHLPCHLSYKKPTPDGHKYTIDFETMKQIDIYFPGDDHRNSNVRCRTSFDQDQGPPVMSCY
jgi:hypothetical protein